MGLEEKDESVHRKLVADRALTLDVGCLPSSVSPASNVAFQVLKISGHRFCGGFFFFFFHFEKTETGIKNLCSSLDLAVKRMYRVMLHLLIPGTLICLKM